MISFAVFVSDSEVAHFLLFVRWEAVDCKELMRSFGWDTTDAFTQHDAQELNRILCDRLEEPLLWSDPVGLGCHPA